MHSQAAYMVGAGTIVRGGSSYGVPRDALYPIERDKDSAARFGRELNVRERTHEHNFEEVGLTEPPEVGPLPGETVRFIGPLSEGDGLKVNYYSKNV